MGRPGQFPTHEETDESSKKLIEQRISNRVAPLAEGKGRLVLLLIPNRRAFASSRIYQAENGSIRQLFVITEDSDVIAYMDVGLDRERQVAVCGTTRSSKAPTEFGNLEKLNPFGDGFAREDDSIGKLLVGLTVYALRREGITELKVVEYTPDTDATDAFSSAGTQKADFQSHVYRHVPEELRGVVASSLRISA